jgi:NAD(P) transhydrogenase subunit alpha
MKIGVLKEIVAGEKRVALNPGAVGRLSGAGCEVVVQSGAGEDAMITDEAYREAGAKILGSSQEVCSEADIIPKVQRPVNDTTVGKHEAQMMKEGLVLVSYFMPHEDPELLNLLAERRITAFSMNLIPRITRAQSMDVLSSQATVSGYQAVLIGATAVGRFFPMLTTAAGTIAPAKVLVLGAGVAGLHAIATARRLGAVVEAFDIRPAVKEEVESLGAKFIDVAIDAGETQDAGGYAKDISEEAKAREQAFIKEHVRGADVVITTALVPGKPAPLLVTEDMVSEMSPGSVVVDLAAENGGNCALTERGREIVKYGVVIHGPLNIPSMMPFHASQMYSRNISNFLGLIVQDSEINLDFEDEILKEACLTHDGKILYQD